MKRPDQIVYKMCAVVSVREARHCVSEVLNRREGSRSTPKRSYMRTQWFVYGNAMVRICEPQRLIMKRRAARGYGEGRTAEDNLSIGRRHLTSVCEAIVRISGHSLRSKVGISELCLAQWFAPSTVFTSQFD